MKLRCIITFTCLWLIWPALAQQLSFRHYTTAEGLPHSVVFRSFQDAKGFMWFGTDYGLTRFDGKRFKTYYPADSSSFTGVLSIIGNKANELTVAYYKQGIYRINANCPDSVRPLPVDNTPGKVIQLLHFNNLLWYLERDGRIGIISGGKYIPVKVSAKVYKMRQMGRILFLATEKGIYIWRGREVVHVPGMDETVFDIIRDKDGYVWTAGKGKVTCYLKGVLQQEYAFPGDYIQTLACDRLGRIWLASMRKGLCYIANSTVYRLDNEPGFHHVMANDITEDRNGNIWIATYGDGVYCFYNRFIRSYTLNEGLPDGYITTIAEDRNHRIWAGTLTSVNYLEGNRFKRMEQQEFVPGNPIRAIMQDAKGRYVLGTFIRIIYTDQNFKTLWKIDSSGTALWSDNNGEAYAGGYGLVYKLNAEKQSYILKHLSAYNQKVNRLLQGKNHSVWLATDSGLVQMDSAGSIRSFLVRNGLPANGINDICFDRAGRLWIATENGLCCMNDQNIVANYGVLSGLSHAKCNALVFDSIRNGLWISTIKGINFFDGHSFFQINTEQGLLSDETNRLLLDSRYNLWVGTVNGLSKIDLRHIELNKPPPSAFIDEVKLNGTSLFAETDSLYQLPYNTNTFTVYLSSAEYINSGTVTYSYRLNNASWNETPNAQVDFANLAPGNYTLYVRARSKTANWGVPAIWNFVIVPPVWKTTWFRILLIVALAIIIWLLLRWRIQLIRNRENEKLTLYKKIQTFKQQSLTSLLSPHFVFNALNSIQHYISEFDKRSANEYLASFAGLIRKTMDDASQVFITLRDEIEHLELYMSLEKLRFREKLEYEIVIGQDIDQDDVFVPSMLIQPYVENAIWHGLMNKPGGGKVSVRISKADEGYLSITIEDDGVGMDHTQEATFRKSTHKPRGTGIMQERLQLLSGIIEKPIRLTVGEGTDGHGTRVVLHIPNSIVPLKEDNA